MHVSNEKILFTTAKIQFDGVGNRLNMLNQSFIWSANWSNRQASRKMIS